MARFRVRVSMLNLLLFCTVFAMGVALWRNGREIVPLRAELKTLRKELGYFYVEDRSRIHFLESGVPTGTQWRWRIYLPPGNDYQLRYYVGEFGELDLQDKSSALAPIRGSTGGLALPDGQFTLNVALNQFDGNWFLSCAYDNEIQASFQISDTSGWFEELLLHERFSEGNSSDVSLFSNKEPVVLLHCRRKDEVSTGGTPVLRKADGEVSSFIIWLEQEK